jgi:transketolase
MMNGMALHGGFIPYGATFLVFMEYARNAVRMAALMRQRVLFVYTHDSIGLGEDGPTHQPVEQIANLRLTPHLDTWRPCDTVESAVAWKTALQRTDGPSALIFSRQSLAHQQRDSAQLANVARGGYILQDCEGAPEAIIIATGSEVGIAQQATDALTVQGRKVRLVSMPCTEVFERQDAAYQALVLPATVTARVAIEAAHADYWYKYVGLAGKVIGMTDFGASAPAHELFEVYGFTVDNITATVTELL